MKKLLLLLFIYAGEISGQIIITIAGGSTVGFNGDGGPATAAQLNFPCDLLIDSVGNILFTDLANYRVRKINTSGVITTIAGGGTSGAGDGGPATSAQLAEPAGLSYNSGNLYISDASANTIRTINSSGIINTISSLSLWQPAGIAFDKNGNLYIADSNFEQIDKVSSTGNMSVFAGNGIQGYSGDGGPATNAELSGPVGITTDKVGNIYIADYQNSCIRKVSTSGIITTIAGVGATAGFSGDGGPATAAKLTLPFDIIFDAVGNLYFSDEGNNRVRMIDTLGIIKTIVGNGTAGFSGDSGLAITAELNQPRGLAIDSNGNLYISDAGNNRIRLVCSGGQFKQSNSIINSFCGNNSIQEINSTKNVFIFPNPTSDQFFIEANTTDKLNVDLYDVNGRHVFSAFVKDKSSVNVATLDNGIYTLTIKTADRIINKKLVIVH